MTDKRGPISAPYEAQFNPDGPSDMFADNLPAMVGHVAKAVQCRDKRFRGFVRVTNHDRTLTFLELNVLGSRGPVVEQPIDAVHRKLRAAEGRPER